MVIASAKQLRFYVTAEGRVPAQEWLGARVGTKEYGKIMVRLERVKQGNFGDHKAVGEGVGELRVDFGPGYRVYFGMDGGEIVILLLAGAKKTQGKDIETAQAYWRDYRA